MLHSTKDRSKEVLSFFQKNLFRTQFVSGEEIAKALGFSRTAVWHHIDTLRRLGYEFEAVPRLGYRLVKSPDRLFPDDVQSELATKVFGRTIYYYDATESTNDIADQLAHEGAPEGTLVLAEYQRKGRGRMGRAWFSPKGKNLLLSLILRPKLDPSFVSLITVMSAVALARTLCEQGFEAQIKWPNDIYIEGKKAAGILTEMTCEQDRIRHLVLGIGVNVNLTSQDIPSHLPMLTSLAMLKAEPVGRIPLLQRLLRNLETLYCRVEAGHHDQILEEWARLSVLRGKWVEIERGDERVEGVVLGTDSKGALLLKLGNGLVESVLSGDVQIKNG